MMKSTPSSSPASKMGMTFGWSIAAAIFDSRRKRSRKRSSSRVLGEDQLEGHRALQRELLGAVDDPHVSVADHLLDAAPREDGARRELRSARRAPLRGLRAGGRSPGRAPGWEPGRAAAAADAGRAGRPAAADGSRGRALARLGQLQGASSRPGPSRPPSAPGALAGARRSRTSRSPSRDPRSSARRSASRVTRAWRRESS